MNDINNISNRTIVRFLAVTAIFVGGIYVAYLIRHQLEWLGIAFFLAIALNPAVERFSKRMPRKSRALATGLVFFIILAFIVVMAVTMLPPLISQTQSLIRNIPHLTNLIANGDNPFSQFLRQYNLVPQLQLNQQHITSAVSAIGGSALGFIKIIFASLIATLTTLVMTFFMLVEGPKWIEMMRQASSKKELRQIQHREELITQMYETVSGYVNGNLLTSLISAIVTAIILSIIGVPYSIPLGILVGIFDLLPLIGATLGAVIVVAVSLFHSLASAIIMTIFFLVYQQLENHILQPWVYSKTVDISPLTVLVAALIGAALAGLVGALVAIPIAASVLILVKDYLKNR